MDNLLYNSHIRQYYILRQNCGTRQEQRDAYRGLVRELLAQFRWETKKVAPYSEPPLLHVAGSLDLR